MDRNAQIANFDLSKVLLMLPESCIDIIDNMTGRKDIWKKRFSTNVLPYIKTVLLGRYYLCDFWDEDNYNLCVECYSDLICDIKNSGCYSCNTGYNMIIKECSFQEFMYKAKHTTNIHKWIRLTRVTKFEDMKNIIKKFMYFRRGYMASELRHAYYRIRKIEPEKLDNCVCQ